MSATIVDGFEFCRTGEQRSGATAVAAFERLAVESVDKAGDIRWTFAGGRHPKGYPQLTMTVEGEVALVCQRCLAAYRQPLASQTALVLARDEADADATEENLADDSIDVIVGSTALNLLQLVEDEVLLSLPLSPKHEVCPGEAPKPVSGKPDSPFSVLKQLKS